MRPRLLPRELFRPRTCVRALATRLKPQRELRTNRIPTRNQRESQAQMIELTLNGREQSNLHDFQVPRINQMPEVEVHIVSFVEAPSGVGEPATPVIAPAVANAIAAVTGKRLRDLTLSNGSLTS